MGFGLLFIGYLFAFGFTAGANYIVSIVGIIGSIIIFSASKKLSRYDKSFNLCKISGIILGISYVFNTAIQLSASTSVISADSILVKLAKILIILSVFTFNAFMYKGIYKIAHKVDDVKLSNDAVRDFIFMVAYYLTMSLTFISPYISLIASILSIVWLVLSVWLTLSAYMRICLPGDEDMPEKKKSKD